ncbi:aminotransferase [Rubrivivax gelatinosus]|nr:aminotransferase [Rubrivivax gelatinosus]
MSFTDPSVIDVRTIAPMDRHPLILERLNSLAVGDGIVLVNDLDPLPLKHQLQQLWPGRFSVAYLENGPERWQLEIRKAVPAEAAGSCCSGGRCCG